jgi:crossover junction endodeoxyribonuclease RuvC
MAIILGIDPGLATVGFGVIRRDKSGVSFVDCGVIKTPAKSDLGERLHIIKVDLESILDSVRPDAVGIEELFFAKNVTNAMMVAHARGVILESIHARGIPIYHFTPLQVKNNVAGTGSAEKWQMQEMVKRTLKMRSIPRPDDAADALAIALCAERVAKTSGIRYSKLET